MELPKGTGLDQRQVKLVPWALALGDPATAPIKISKQRSKPPHQPVGPKTQASLLLRTRVFIAFL